MRLYYSSVATYLTSKCSDCMMHKFDFPLRPFRCHACILCFVHFGLRFFEVAFSQGCLFSASSPFYRKSEPRVPLNGQQLFEYRLPKSIHSEVPYGGSGWMLGALDRCYSVSAAFQRILLLAIPAFPHALRATYKFRVVERGRACTTYTLHVLYIFI